MKTLFVKIAASVLVLASMAACSEKVQYAPVNPPGNITEQPGGDSTSTPDYSAFELNVVGRYLKDSDGNIVNLHGFGQTYSPFFNNWGWNDYDVEGCLSYNKRMIDAVLSAGWEMDFIRMHMDPYWSDDPNQESVRYEGHERFSETRFRKYLDEVFVPMAEYMVSRGLYVVMRPPGV